PRARDLPRAGPVDGPAHDLAPRPAGAGRPRPSGRRPAVRLRHRRRPAGRRHRGRRGQPRAGPAVGGGRARPRRPRLRPRSPRARRRLAAASPWFRALYREGGDRIRRFMLDGDEVDGVRVRVVELNAEAGDVVAMLPWTLHSLAMNCGSGPRFMVTHTVWAA